MSRKLFVTLALFSFLFVSTSFAAVESIKISGDINSEFITRDLALGETTVSDNDHDTFFSQIRLRFDADLTEGISAVLRLINERGWGEDNSADLNNADDLDIDLGYIELKEFLYEPLTLIVGRQRLRYGTGFILGDPDTSQGKITGSSNATGLPSIVQDLSLRKSFDAIRAILDFAPLTVDLIFAQVDEVTTNSRHDDELIVGFNAAYSMGDHGEVSELYFFNADSTPQTTATDVKDNVNVVGARTFFHLSEQFSLGVEGAYQFGDYRVSATDHDHLSAWAGQFISQYRFNNDSKAELTGLFTFLSGDRSETEERFEGWNPLWEDQTTPELMNILLNMSNRQIIGIEGSMVPKEDLLIGFRYARGYLVEKFTGPAIMNAIGPLAGDVFYVKPNKKHLGDEVDIYAVYDYTEDVQLKVSAAWLVPGTVFTKRNDNLCYSVRTGVTLSF